MAKDNAQTWENIEDQAYHAFREWPIWLVLRQRELAQHLEQAKPSANTSAAATNKAKTQSK